VQHISIIPHVGGFTLARAAKSLSPSTEFKGLQSLKKKFILGLMSPCAIQTSSLPYAGRPFQQALWI